MGEGGFALVTEKIKKIASKGGWLPKEIGEGGGGWLP